MEERGGVSDSKKVPHKKALLTAERVTRYLGSHYELLREDAYSTLRDATLSVKMQPDMNDMTEISIYENVSTPHNSNKLIIQGGL